LLALGPNFVFSFSCSKQSDKIYNKEYLFHIRGERGDEGIENRILKKIFGPKMNKVTGEWLRLHNKELCDLYSLPNIIWMI